MKIAKWFNTHLKGINRVLLLIIVLLNAYVIVTPFLPKVTYQVEAVINKPEPVDTPEQRSDIDRTYDHIVIPKMNLDTKIWIGDSEWLIDKGVWHIPESSTPPLGSNTVFAGHRFNYRGTAPFYHLDKVALDDPIVVVWDGVIYAYKVNEIKVVEPTDVYIEDPTEDSRLTIYTCTPLWTNKQRLVVIAGLESTQ